MQNAPQSMKSNQPLPAHPFEPTRPAPGHLPTGQLDAFDQAALVYLVLPVLLFAGWFLPVPALALAAAVLWGLSRFWHGPRAAAQPLAPWGWMGWLMLAALAVGLTAVSGTGHLVFANTDWHIRDAVLRDLAETPWPPGYLNDGQGVLLRAPVAYYLPAAALGAVFGNGSGSSMLDAAILTWTALGVGLVAWGAALRCTRPRERLVLALVLVMFGGWDLLGDMYFELVWPASTKHLEWWATFAQYSSSLTLLAWVPNHALPAWLGTLLVLRHWRQPSLARIAPCLMAVTPLWSPLIAIGLAPFVLLGLDWRRHAGLLLSPLRQWPWGLVLVVVAAYITMDSSAIPSGWQFRDPATFSRFFPTYVLFCLLEFGLLAGLLLLAGLRDRPLLLAIGVLLLLPLYRFGEANDLAMRASVPALMVLALAAAHALTAPTATPRGIRAGLVLVLAVGAIGAWHEPWRALTEPRWARSGDSFPEAVAIERGATGPAELPPHYVARPNRPWLTGLMRTPTPVLPHAAPQPGDSR